MQPEPIARSQPDRRHVSRSEAGTALGQTCQHCRRGEHIARAPMPDGNYRCASCGAIWATNLDGALTLSGRVASG